MKSSVTESQLLTIDQMDLPLEVVSGNEGESTIQLIRQLLSRDSIS
jgi:hypothetical protein